MGYRRILVETENRNYVRDVNSRALLANDRGAADEYRLKSKMMKKNKELTEQVASLEERLAQLEKLVNGE